MTAAGPGARCGHAVVAGPPGVARDVVARLAAGAAAGPVAVLVDPREEHWRAAVGRPVVVVTTEALGPDAITALVLRGAEAVVGADAPPERVADAVATVSAGGSVLDPEVARRVVALARSAAAAAGSAPLSAREGEILGCIARGLSVKQTARRLGVAHKTVENVQGRLYRKLGVRNRAQAVARAHSLGLLGD